MPGTDKCPPDFRHPNSNTAWHLWGTLGTRISSTQTRILPGICGVLWAPGFQAHKLEYCLASVEHFGHPDFRHPNSNTAWHLWGTLGTRISGTQTRILPGFCGALWAPRFQAPKPEYCLAPVGHFGPPDFRHPNSNTAWLL